MRATSASPRDSQQHNYTVEEIAENPLWYLAVV